MKEELIKKILQYKEALDQKARNNDKEEIYLYYFVDYHNQYDIREKESQEIDEAIDYFADHQIYEIFDVFLSRYWYNDEQGFRVTSDRWEYKFPYLLNYLEKKLNYHDFVRFLNKGYHKHYFNPKFLIDHFDHVKDYASQSILCAGRMYELTKDEKYLEYTKTLALRKLLARITMNFVTKENKSNNQVYLSDEIYRIIKPHLPFDRVLLLDEDTLHVKEEYGNLDQLYKIIRNHMKKEQSQAGSYYGSSHLDYGDDLTFNGLIMNVIKDKNVEKINRVAMELGIFRDTKIEKVDEKYYDVMERTDGDVNFLAIDEDRLLLELFFNFESASYYNRTQKSPMAKFMLALANENRLDEIMKRFQYVYDKLGEYEITSVSWLESRYDIILTAYAHFNFEKNKFILPANDDASTIYNFFNMMQYPLYSDNQQMNDMVIHYCDNLYHLIPYAHCHDSLFKWILQNHLEPLYDYIQICEEYYIERMLYHLKKDDKRLAYLLATKVKKYKKRAKEALYRLDNTLKALDVEPIDKKHKKAIEEVRVEYEMIVNPDLDKVINDLAKKHIKKSMYKKYDWIDLDQLELQYKETKLTKEAMIYLFKMIEDAMLEELPMIYDHILSNISSENPLRDYERLMEAYKAKGFKPNQRAILYFCKVLLDPETLYKLIEDTKDQKLTKSIAITYMDVYRFKSTGSELELLINLSATSKNKEIIKLSKKQINAIKRKNKIAPIQFNRLELSMNSFVKDEEMIFNHSSGEFKLEIGKGNKLSFIKEGEVLKRLPAAKTDEDKIIKDRINNLKKEIKKVEAKYLTYLKNLFHFNYELTVQQFNHLMQYPVSDKFIHSIIFQSEDTLFTIDESNDLMDIYYDEVTLDEHAKITLVSNLELEEDVLKEVKEYIEDNQLKTELEQFDLKEMELKEEYDLKEQELNYIAINNKLEEMGFVLEGETYSLDLGNNLEDNLGEKLKVEINAYLGSVSDTYNMTMENIRVRGTIDEKGAIKLSRVLNQINKIGINI